MVRAKVSTAKRRIERYTKKYSAERHARGVKWWIARMSYELRLWLIYLMNHENRMLETLDLYGIVGDIREQYLKAGRRFLECLVEFTGDTQARELQNWKNAYVTRGLDAAVLDDLIQDGREHIELYGVGIGAWKEVDDVVKKFEAVQIAMSRSERISVQETINFSQG